MLSAISLVGVLELGGVDSPGGMATGAKVMGSWASAGSALPWGSFSFLNLSNYKRINSDLQERQDCKAEQENSPSLGGIVSIWSISRNSAK